MDQLTEVQQKQALRAAIRPEIQGGSYFEGTLRNLGLKSLPEGMVLDIGSGTFGEFQSRARELYPKTKLVSVTPLFGTDEAKDNLLWMKNNIGSENSHEDSIAAIAQQLPFKDESFDLVISNAAVPVHLPFNKDHYKATFLEAIRVAKGDAKLIFAPMEATSKDLAVSVLQDLQIPNLEIETVEIPVEDFGNGVKYDAWFRITLHKK